MKRSFIMEMSHGFHVLAWMIGTYSDIDFRRYLQPKVELCYLCVYYSSIRIPLNVTCGSSAAPSAFGGVTQAPKAVGGLAPRLEATPGE